ncbi:hypothetical protein P8S54_00575 [Thiomicrospira sp. R3]|uniref:hypothetical protein n=1 Tax=Thiomicrospira sp. R3 TaxID=3035472 RepID=UPI00259B0E2B|nr:hypothetical protein [Thiomicrospira sp. R3]WFE68826.1 hypothetical protein P8S54_00575 [Thiomicrospira sp. R3]
MQTIVNQARESGLSETNLQQMKQRFIADNPGNSSRQLVQQLGASQRTMERWLKQLKDAEKIEFHGSSKTGGYYVK